MKMLQRLWMIFLLSTLLAQSPEAQADEPSRPLPLPGKTLTIAGRPAFLIPGKSGMQLSGKAWVWYAPTLPGLPGSAERWMFDHFVSRGISIAGIDAGESYGSPQGNEVYDQLYEYLMQQGFSPRPVMLGRSRGGLMTMSWAVSNPDRVAAFAGIYPVFNLASYPGLQRAAPAFELTADQLEGRLSEYNPVDRLQQLAARRVPLFAIHGDVDRVVPLELNSGLAADRYKEFSGSFELMIPPGQGHNMWNGFFECQELVEFVVRHSLRANAAGADESSQSKARE